MQEGSGSCIGLLTRIGKSVENDRLRRTGAKPAKYANVSDVPKLLAKCCPPGEQGGWERLIPGQHQLLKLLHQNLGNDGDGTQPTNWIEEPCDGPKCLTLGRTFGVAPAGHSELKSVSC